MQRKLSVLTALAALGQQHKGREGLQAKLVCRKVALNIGLELGHSDVAARQLVCQLSVVSLQALHVADKTGGAIGKQGGQGDA